MERSQARDVALRQWQEDDLWLLHRLLGDPAMTEHLGGPETPEQIEARHARYLALDPAGGRVFVITAGPGRRAAGFIGFWEREWQGESVWETGWSVLPELQGLGIATRAVPLVAEAAAGADPHRSIHAYPGVDNGPSNAICRKTGFTLAGAYDFEYPPGHQMRCNDWFLAPRA